MPRTILLYLALSYAAAAASASGATIKAITADAAQAGNPAAAAFDKDTESKWAAQGRGRWIQCELSEAVPIDKIGIGFDHGERDYAFEILTSDDGMKWLSGAPAKFQSRGGGEKALLYKIDPKRARFVRITVHGNNVNDWANIHTIHIPGVSPGDPPAPPAPGASESPEYVVTEWASDPAIANSVAISIDDRGRAYVTVARRRKESSLDIRHHQDLVKADLSLTTVEERRQWYRDYLTGKGWVPDRNGDGKRDWQDLTVQKDNVTRVADEDGDGKAESLRVLDEYHSEVTGICAGVLAAGDDVFVAAEPEFLRYFDKDGDGFPETRQLVATGLQVRIGQGGHNLSGVALGPDGRVYWSLGDKGHYVDKNTKDGQVYHMPNAGAIFRCELDGTDVERYSSGERNAQELAFDAFGNLFSMDNDGDYPGEKERALYITEGSEHGWRLNWQWMRKQDFTRISGLPAYNPWMDERLFLPDREDHAAYLTPTIGNFGPGPCGFTANPGTALSPALADCFFMTNQQSQVRVFKFHPKGAFFAFEELPAIKGGVSNTGLAIGPDGALFSASYGGKRGSIFRFDVAESQRHPARAETQKILALDAKESTFDELVPWLDHPDQRVRMKAQFELVRRGPKGGGFDKLQLALTGAKTTLGKLHAIWGLGQIARRDPQFLTFLLPAWDSGEPELIAQAAKVTGETRGGVANLPALRAGLTHPSPRVQFFCAIALGNRADKVSAPAIVELLETGGATDPYLRHAAVMGLKGALTPDQLAELSTHESKTVRLGAIVALRKLAAPEIRAFLEDEDELVLLEAARAIHDDASIPGALPDLSAVLERKALSNEALMRRAINAAFRHGSGSDLEHLTSYLERGEGSPKLRRTALASILWWSAPPVLDPVEGRYRKHAPRDAAAANEAVARLQPIILKDGDLREVLLNGISVRGEAKWLAGTKEHFGEWPPELQVRLLDALAKTKAPDLKEFVLQGLSSLHDKVRERARIHAGRAGVPTIDLLLAVLDDPNPLAKGKAVLQLARIDEPRAQSKLAELVTTYRAGKADPRWKLELWQAAKLKGIDLPATPDRLEHGGNPARGKQLVMQHAAAQCIRCHRVGKAAGADFSIGPDLTKIGATRDRAHLVASLLEPTKEISDGYGTILLKTKAGEEVTGLLTKKADDGWIVTLADGKQRTFNPAEVASHTLTSVMPPMAALMKPEEIRDVVSYLAGLK